MKVLISGCSGQDAYFLTKLLKSKGYNIYGLIRRNSQKSLGTISENINLLWGDITDENFVSKIIRKNNFDEVYHFAAQSFVAYSFENPKSTYDVNIGGTLNVCNAIKEFSPKTKLYNASSSEMFGHAPESPQSEVTQFYPRSPYGISKLAGYWTVKNYREAYDLFFCNGILFNHESEKRGVEFVTRKIIEGVKEIKAGKVKYLELGNLDAKRDWGYAGDYVEGMYLMLQADKPDDYVLATGESHTVREFVELAFAEAGIKDWEKHVKINKEFYRPTEVNELKGDYTKAEKILGWKPKTDLKSLIKIMYRNV